MKTPEDISAMRDLDNADFENEIHVLVAREADLQEGRLRLRIKGRKVRLALFPKDESHVPDPLTVILTRETVEWLRAALAAIDERAPLPG
jgi:hypothetical protein